MYDKYSRISPSEISPGGADLLRIVNNMNK